MYEIKTKKNCINKASCFRNLIFVEMFLVQRERSERRNGSAHYLETLKNHTKITFKIKLVRVGAQKSNFISASDLRPLRTFTPSRGSLYAPCAATDSDSLASLARRRPSVHLRPNGTRHPSVHLHKCAFSPLHT